MRRASVLRAGGLALLAQGVVAGTRAVPPALAQTPAGGTFSLRPLPDVDPERPANPYRARVSTIRSWFTFEASPGATFRDTAQISNPGALPVDLALYAVDATTGITSGLVLQSNDAARVGVSRWIEVSVPTVHLEPGETRDVPFTVSVPADARPGEHWGGLIAEDTNVRRGSGQFSVNHVLRTGVALGVVLPGAREERLVIRGLSQKVVNDLTQVFVIEIANEGNVMVKPRGSLEIKDTGGRPVGRFDLALDNVLAGTMVPYEVFWQQETLPAGRYQATVTLQTPASPPAMLAVPALEVKAPGSRLAPAPVAGQPNGTTQQVTRIDGHQAGATPQTGGPWQTVLTAGAGAGVMALGMAGLGAYRRLRRAPSADAEQGLTDEGQWKGNQR